MGSEPSDLSVRGESGNYTGESKLLIVQLMTRPLWAYMLRSELLQLCGSH